jgi:peptidoglycan hydrolase CwlO-like protein
VTDEELNQRFDDLQTSFEAALKTEVKAAVTAEGVVTRRHFDVVAEALRTDIKVIAEGHGALRQDVVDLKAGQARLETRQERLEIRQAALEHRQGRLEDGQDRLEERQERLEQRQESMEEGQQKLATLQQGLVNDVRQLAARFPA